jgi:SAM-dependent methyltransferase
MQLDLHQFATNLIEKDGIYFSELDSQISYPEEGNQSCFELEDNSFWFKHRNDCIHAAIEKFAKEKLFFDIGGGNGFVSGGLERKGLASVIVEPGIQGCLNAKSRGLKNIICSTLEGAEFHKTSLEAVGLFDVVEHIESDINFLKTIATFMKPDGTIFITVPAYRWLWSNEDDIAGHYRRYTLKSIKKVLNEAGFEVQYATYIFSILVLPIFFWRCIPSKLGFSSKKLDTGKAKKEHSNKKSIFSGLSNRIWKWELNKIKKGKRVFGGSSCFVVARKV